MSRLHQWLAGVRVLDLSRYRPGPFAGMLLADMGADVLKIEGPDGDDMQHLGPRDAAGAPIFYAALNGGKKVRRMNLKEADARAAFLELVDDADVLLESFRPGVMARLGLGQEVLTARNPRLIVCALSGYGANGPLAQAAGHDANYLAQTGVLYRNGRGTCSYVDPPLSDDVGALFAVIAIQGALRERERSGRGCHIDTGLADAVWPLQSFQLADFGKRGYAPGPEQTYLNDGAAWYRAYPTRDGRHIALGAAGGVFWRRFCEAAGRPDWIAREHEPMPQRALIAEVGALVAQMSLAECIARFGPADCCVSPVLMLDEALSSAQVAARGLVRRAPDGALQALFPARVDGAVPRLRPAPRATTGGFGAARAAEGSA
ncbi:MAG: CoA transferase [Burkholderiales bacterium]|nr:CoA transferase [Burkholderiales bacterium]